MGFLVLLASHTPPFQLISLDLLSPQEKGPVLVVKIGQKERGAPLVGQGERRWKVLLVRGY